MNKSKDQEYATSEFPLAVTLLCMKVPLVGMRPSEEDPQRIEFLFGKDELIKRLTDGYWANSLMVEPKTFWSYCRELKSRIKAVK